MPTRRAACPQGEIALRTQGRSGPSRVKRICSKWFLPSTRSSRSHSFYLQGSPWQSGRDLTRDSPVGIAALVLVWRAITEYRERRFINSPCFEVDRGNRNTGKVATPLGDLEVPCKVRGQYSLSTYLTLEPPIESSSDMEPAAGPLKTSVSFEIAEPRRTSCHTQRCR